jgi:hypothetical protein
MQSESLSLGAMDVEELRTAPTAGMFREGQTKAAQTAGERTQLGQAGIQAGAQSVTRDILHGEGYGKEDEPMRQPKRKGDRYKPRELYPHEEVRITREINNFKRWINATGELQVLENGKPTKADLVREVKRRLDAYLAKFRRD